MRLPSAWRRHAWLIAALGACAPSIRPLSPSGPSPQPAPDAPAPLPSAAAQGQPAAVTSSAAPPDESPAAITIPDSLDAATRRVLAEAAASIGLDPGRFFAAPAGVPAADSSGEEPTWDLDVLSYATHDQVARYVELFSGRARERIQSRLQRGKRYEPMIRETFRAAGIPEDMYYLALVESGYDPHAYSRAAAVGMWQFMSSTARGVGLRVDPWVDERRDPIKSTQAAARFLTDLHRQFGSYYLAAAAYNGGPGRVSRGLARFQDELQEVVGDDRFFALAEQSYLRSETRNYVPQLIAAALIGKAPSRYGMAVSDSVVPFQYDSARVPPLTSLGVVARAAGAGLDEVRDLNPHFLRGATPREWDGFVRIPAGRLAHFDSAWAVMDPSERVSFSSITTRKGQSFASIAAAHGIDARRLAWYNPGLNTRRRLPAGRTLVIPAAHVLASARDVPDPSIERYGSAQVARGGRVVHVVRRGESLGLIAKRYRTSVATLRRVNGLKRTVVYPGQSIIVRTSGGSSGKAVSSRTGARRSAAKSSTASRRKAAGGTASARKKAPPKKKTAASRRPS